MHQTTTIRLIVEGEAPGVLDDAENVIDNLLDGGGLQDAITDAWNDEGVEARLCMAVIRQAWTREEIIEAMQRADGDLDRALAFLEDSP